MRLPSTLIHALLGLLLGALASAQEDSARTSERFLKYLRQAPYHEQAFARFLAACAENAGTEAVMSELDAELDQPAARVLLARLHAARGEPERALALLEPLDDGDARLSLLRARLELSLGDSAAALAELERAAAAARALSLDERRELAVERARLSAQLERPDEATAAIEVLGDLEPHSVGAQLDAGALAEELELLEAALARYAAAERAARDDPAGRVNALAARARLLERVGRLDEALAAWDTLSELIARGHWLRGELDARRIALRASVGSLTAWLEQLSPRSDLASRELLARALEAAGEPARALTELRAAAREYPNDLRLTRRLIELARAHASPEALVGDLERAVDAHPRERELAFELGLAHARCGRRAAALARLETWAAERPDDPEPALRVARALAELEWREEAARFLALAGERASQDLALLEQCASELDALGRAAERDALFASAFEQRAGAPEELAALGALHLRRADSAAADRCYSSALRLAPDDPALLEALADLRAAQDRHEEANVLWRRRLELLEGDELARAADTLAGRMHASGGADEWALREGERLEAAPPTLAGTWLLAELHARARKRASAAAVLRRVAAHYPDDVALRRRLVTLLRDKGELAGAIKESRALLELAPDEAARTWLEIARLQARPIFRKGLDETLAQAAAAARDDAELLVEIGRLAQRERRHAVALEVLARAVELAPGDAEPRLVLASELFATRRDEAGVDALVAGWRRSPTAVRERVVERIVRDLGGARDTALADAASALLLRLEARPGDGTLARLAVELALHAGQADSCAAIEALASPAVRADPDFALCVGLGHARRGDRERALDAFARAASAGVSVGDERRLEIVGALGALGCRERAVELALDCVDVLDAAQILEDTLGPAPARELLEVRAGAGALDLLGWARLGELRAQDDPRGALEAWTRHEELRGGRTWTSALAVAGVARAAGEHDRADEACAWLAEFAVERSSLRLGAEGEPIAWAAILCGAARTRPRDAALVAMAVDAAHDERAAVDEVFELLTRRAEGAEEVAPEGLTPADWRRRLLVHERKLFRVARDHATRRRAELDEARAAGASLRADQWAQLLWLARGAPGAAALVEAALAASEEPLVIAASARALEMSGDHERALAVVDRALAAGAAREDPVLREVTVEALTLELAPRPGAYEVTPEVARLAAATSPPRELDADLPRLLTRAEALRARARLAATLGRPELARDALDALERCEPPATTLTRVLACLEAREYERAAEPLAALIDEQRDALTALPKQAATRAVAARERTWSALVRRCLARDDPRRAWALARAAPDAGLHQAWMRDAGLADATRADFERELERAMASADADALGELRAAAAQLAELELELKRWPDALATLRRVAPALPADSWPNDLAAPLAAVLGQGGLAAELHRAQLDGKRDGRFHPAAPIRVWPARELTLELPPPMRLEVALQGHASDLVLHLTPLVKSARNRAAEDPLHNHLGLLHLALAGEDLEHAAATFEALAAAEPEWLGGRALGMLRVLESLELGARASRFLAPLYDAAATNGPVPLALAEAYARALYDAERYEELHGLIDRQLAACEPRPREVESWATDWRVEVEFGGR